MILKKVKIEKNSILTPESNLPDIYVMRKYLTFVASKAKSELVLSQQMKRLISQEEWGRKAFTEAIGGITTWDSHSMILSATSYLGDNSLVLRGCPTLPDTYPHPKSV